MIRHIEITINFDITSWGEKEDFKTDTQEQIEEFVRDYIYTSGSELSHEADITKIWYEEED